MTDAFSLDRVTAKAAVFDEKKLEWMNGIYMRDCPTDSILQDVVNIWKGEGLIGKDRSANDPYLRTVVSLLKERSRTLMELAGRAAYFFADPRVYEEKAVKKHFKENTVDLIRTVVEKLERVDSFDHKTLEDLYRKYAEGAGVSVGKLIHPTRLAVTGVSYGPGLFELLEVLGKTTVLRRMRKAIDWLESQKRE